MFEPAMQERTTIRRLQVRSGDLDALTARLRLENVLGGTAWRPPGLPPAAILVVRRLRDPRPGLLDLNRPLVHAPAAWERGVQDALDAVTRQAARPAHGPVPATAQAVLFADHAEWLACLAADWLSGRVTSQWWWHGVLRIGDTRRAIQDAWLEAPTCVPSALAHLARLGDVAAFVRAWPPTLAQRLLERILTVFALSDLAAALDTLEQRLDLEGGGADNSSAGGSDPSGPPAARPASLASRRLPPWAAWAPESARDGLSPASQRLLGIGLTLARAPQVARATSFAASVRDWGLATVPGADALAQAEIVSPGAPSERPGVADGDDDSAPPAGHVAEPGPPGAPDIDKGVTLADAAFPPPAWASDASDIQPASPLPRPPEPQAAESSLEATRTEAPASLKAPPTRVGQSSASPTPTAAQVTSELGVSLTTAFGGVFYLVNVAQALGLYGDFTMPRDPGLALPIWDCLALLGQQFVGDRLRDDPLWNLLAELAGRDVDEPPGRGFDPPSDWRIPPDWLAPFAAPAVWRWSNRGGRLRVEHPLSFCILDVPLPEGQPSRHVHRETAVYSSSAMFTLRRGRPLGVYPAPSTAPLDRWLGWLTPYVQARLSRALGLADAAQLGILLCEHAARVYVTATRVDIMLSLAELPIEIRLAGLDRDPGWVPAAGRSLRFHFE